MAVSENEERAPVSEEAARTRRPAIIAIDDEPTVLAAVSRDLRRRFGEDYRIVRASSGQDALALLKEMHARGDEVALMVSDQRMPGMEGTEFLTLARKIYPEAKRTLLTAYADTQAAITAINDVDLDYYLLKPWDPPEEQLYPVVEDLLQTWQSGAAMLSASGVRIVGHRFSKETHDLRDFLARNRVPGRWYDVERDPEAKQLLEVANVPDDRLPVAFLEDGSVLERPSVLELAERLGVAVRAESDHYDLVIVGGGPAGLAAAVYGASEGLRTLMVESDAPGGQAGQSSRIENYLGFPTGLSGSDLAQRATTQARRLGAELLAVSDAVALRVEGAGRIVQLSGGQELSASSVLVSSGVSYRKMPAPGFEQFTGAGVYYGAAMTEAKSCLQQHVVVIGAANSAGQAAVYFARYAARVTMLVRADSLAKSMSHYLTEQIAQQPLIKVLTETQAVEAVGSDGRLTQVKIRGPQGEDMLDVDACFVFIGATPRTEWLEGVVARDERGFILAGPEARDHGWPLAREPLALETSVPGVFVAGDVRARSIKRVASAVGEGSMAVSLIHQYLAEGVARMSTDTGHHTDAEDRELISTGHPSLEDLRTIDLLAELTDEQLQQWSDAAELYEVQNGSTISREGEESVGTILVFEGTLHGTIRNGNRDEPLSDQVGPTWVGAIQTLTGDLTSGLTLRAAGAARYAVVAPEPFTDLVVSQRPVFQQVMSRMRPVMQAMTQREQNRERLTSLGTMAAGLAHELNNPAAAARRTASDLADALEILSRSTAVFVESGIEREQAVDLVDLQTRALQSCANRTALDALDAADREDELQDALEEAGAPEPWTLAESFATAGLDGAFVQQVADAAGPVTPSALRWIGASLSARHMARELTDSTDQMSQLVKAVKQYAYMDQGEIVQVDVREGLENTLMILGHKLKKTTIEVTRDYDESLGKVTAHGAELNQVWTNLLDNAIDALGSSGHISILTRADGDCAEVDISDDGPGIPPEVRDQVFDPFFTTKEVGRGTGLGLDTARRIIVDRHHGSLTLETRPGRTMFRARVPLDAATRS